MPVYTLVNPKDHIGIVSIVSVSDFQVQNSNLNWLSRFEDS
jgi:hypothetical protein